MTFGLALESCRHSDIDPGSKSWRISSNEENARGTGTINLTSTYQIPEKAIKHMLFRMHLKKETFF